MSNIKTILVPVDFSKCAANAMNFAMEIASRAEARIHAIHVIYPNEHVGDTIYAGMWLDEYVKARLGDLNRWIKRFLKNEAFEKVKFEVSCEIGYPITSIKTSAGRVKADLIVMGTTGATGLNAALLGSNAAGVMSAVQIPVLAVPQKADFLKHADYVFAADFGGDIDKYNWKAAQEILRMQHGALHVLHVAKPGESSTDAGEKDLKKHLKDIPYHFHYMHDSDVSKAVLNYMEASGAKGLIVVSRRHNFLSQLLFKHVSRALVQSAQTPILVLHEA